MKIEFRMVYPFALQNTTQKNSCDKLHNYYFNIILVCKVTCDFFPPVFELHNLKDGVNQNCVSSFPVDEQWKCFIAQVSE